MRRPKLICGKETVSVRVWNQSSSKTCWWKTPLGVHVSYPVRISTEGSHHQYEQWLLKQGKCSTDHWLHTCQCPKVVGWISRKRGRRAFFYLVHSYSFILKLLLMYTKPNPRDSHVTLYYTESSEPMNSGWLWPFSLSYGHVFIRFFKLLLSFRVGGWLQPISTINPGKFWHFKYVLMEKHLSFT